jgi:hypothetical protein
MLVAAPPRPLPLPVPRGCRREAEAEQVVDRGITSPSLPSFPASSLSYHHSLGETCWPGPGTEFRWACCHSTASATPVASTWLQMTVAAVIQATLLRRRRQEQERSGRERWLSADEIRALEQAIPANWRECEAEERGMLARESMRRA